MVPTSENTCRFRISFCKLLAYKNRQRSPLCSLAGGHSICEGCALKEPYSYHSSPQSSQHARARRVGVAKSCSSSSGLLHLWYEFMVQLSFLSPQIFSTFHLQIQIAQVCHSKRCTSAVGFLSCRSLWAALTLCTVEGS